MAYSFDGVNNRLSVVAAPVTAAPLTMYVRYNMTNAPSFQTYGALMIMQNAAQSDFFDMTLYSTAPSRLEYIYRQTTPSVVIALTGINGVTNASTWYSGTAVEASSTSHYVFFETTKSGTNTTSVVPVGVDRIFFGGRSSGRPFNGLLAEAAIWNVALTDDEVRSLSRGFKPFRVRPQNLQFYAPIVRNLHDIRGGLTLTNSNNATVADHPRVY
jgi:hypothetical protein